MKRLIKKNGKQVGIIYHFTDINAIYKILISNSIKNFKYDGISFSRNKNLHQSDIKINVDSLSVRISVDGDKLSNNYKIKPFNYFSKSDHLENDESEELVMTNDITPILSYINEITLFRNKIEGTYQLGIDFEGKFFNSVNQIAEFLNNKYNISVNIE